MCSNVCEQTKFYDSDFCHILELHYGYFDIWYFYWTAAPTAMQFRVILIASNVGEYLDKGKGSGTSSNRKNLK